MTVWNHWTLGVISGLTWFIGASGLVVLRLTHRSQPSKPWRERLAAIAALATVVGFIATTMVLIDHQSFDFSRMSAFARGALAGAMLAAYLQVAASGLVFLVGWSLRRPYESAPLGTVLLEKALSVLLLAGVMGTIFPLLEGEPTGVTLTLILVALYVSLFTGSSLIIPWLTLLAGSRRLDRENERSEELQAWADKKLKAFGRQPVPIQVLQGTVCNAFVLWRPGRPLLVVGSQLLRELGNEEVRAVLAHEIGHLIRRDTVVLVWLGIATALLTALFAQWMFVTLVAGGQPVIGALAICVTNVALVSGVGVYMRRMEIRTDRLAVGLMDGQWKPLAEALTRMARFKDTPLDRKSLTHPSVEARIAAMQRVHDDGP